MENKKEVEDINTDSDLNNINEEEGKIDNENENEKQKRNSLAYNNLGKIQVEKQKTVNSIGSKIISIILNLKKQNQIKVSQMLISS